MSKLSGKELTRAVAKSARKYGYSPSTVRACTSLLLRAIKEYRDGKMAKFR